MSLLSSFLRETIAETADQIRSDTLISTSATVVGTHKDLIRFICTYFDAVTGSLYLVSTGEDKMLMVWKVLPQLELMSSRELNKRANAMCIRPDGTIAIGDKFGDIFSCVPSHFKCSRLHTELLASP